eukprot:1160059-Pelagomonas_calceolata.AAC.13
MYANKLVTTRHVTYDMKLVTARSWSRVLPVTLQVPISTFRFVALWGGDSRLFWAKRVMFVGCSRICKVMQIKKICQCPLSIKLARASPKMLKSLAKQSKELAERTNGGLAGCLPCACRLKFSFSCHALHRPHSLQAFKNPTPPPATPLPERPPHPVRCCARPSCYSFKVFQATGGKSANVISMLGGCPLQAGQGVGIWAIFEFNEVYVPILTRYLYRVHMSRPVWDRTHKDSVRAVFVSGREILPVGRTQSVQAVCTEHFFGQIWLQAAVALHIILIGAAGTIDSYTIKPLINLGVTRQKAKSLASKSSCHAIQRLTAIINTRHALHFQEIWVRGWVGAGRLAEESRRRRIRASRIMAANPPDPHSLCFWLSPRLALSKGVAEFFVGESRGCVMSFLIYSGVWGAGMGASLASMDIGSADRLALQDLQIPEHSTKRTLPKCIFPRHFPDKDRLTFSRPDARLVVPRHRTPRSNSRYLLRSTGGRQGNREDSEPATATPPTSKAHHPSQLLPEKERKEKAT